jgi:energy-coupling factor transporter ATP-binding protein EcfA2
LRNCEFYQKSFVSKLLRIWAGRIRIQNYLFRIRKKVLDPTGSGSTTLITSLQMLVKTTTVVHLPKVGTQSRKKPAVTGHHSTTRVEVHIFGAGQQERKKKFAKETT